MEVAAADSSIRVVAAIDDQMAERLDGMHEAAILTRLEEQPGARSTIIAGTTLIWFDIPSWFHYLEHEYSSYGQYAETLHEFFAVIPSGIREQIVATGGTPLINLEPALREVACRIVEGPYADPLTAEAMFARERALISKGYADLIVQSAPCILVYDQARCLGRISLKEKDPEIAAFPSMNAPVLPAFALEEFPDFIQPRVDMPSSWLSEQVMVYRDERIWQLKDLLGGTFAVHPEIGKLKVFISEGKWSASSLLMHIAAVLGVQICLRSGDYRVETSAVHRDVARNKAFVDGERDNSLKLVSMLERYLTPPYVSIYMESLGSRHFYSGQLTPLSAVNPELRRLVTDLLPEDVGWEAITLRFVFSLTVGCRHSEEAPPVAGLENFTESISSHLIAAIPASEFRFNLPKLPRHYCVDPADAMREHGAVVRYP